MIMIAITPKRGNKGDRGDLGNVPIDHNKIDDNAGIKMQPVIINAKRIVPRKIRDKRENENIFLIDSFILTKPLSFHEIAIFNVKIKMQKLTKKRRMYNTISSNE